MLFKLAKTNLIRNFKNYLLYFFSSVFCILIFYTFLSLSYDSTIKKAASESMLVDYSLKGASIVLVLFAIIFITYSSHFFAQKRKKELGTYVLLGLRKRQIGQMMFYENFAMGILALITGLFGGVFLYKLFVSLLLQFIDVQVSAKLAISPEAMLATTIVFLLLTIITSFEGYRIVYRFTVLDLLKASGVAEKKDKGSKITAIIGIILLLISYTIALTPSSSSVFYKQLPTTIQLVLVIFTMIIGTFLFVGSFLPYALAKIATIKPFYFRGTNMVSIASLRFRMKNQSRMMATIAILIAITLTAIGFTGSLYTNINAQSKNFSSTDYQILQGTPSAAEKLETLAGPTNIDFQAAVPIWKSGDGFLSESDYRKLMAQLFNEKDTPNLQPGEAIALVGKDQLSSKQITQLKSKKQEAENGFSFQVTAVSEENPVKSSTDMLYVLNDSDIETLAKSATKDTTYLYNLKNDTLAIAEKITAQNGKYGDAFFTSRLNFRHENSVSTGSILFVGLFIGLTFLAATGCIIYFKQITEAYNDSPQYHLMQKIGMDQQMIRRTIAKQIAVIFLVPLILGISHTNVSLTAFGQNTNMTVGLALTGIIAVYTVIYAVYYLFTVRNYVKITRNI